LLIKGFSMYPKNFPVRLSGRTNQAFGTCKPYPIRT
jgi:hypothetical protein